MAAGAQRKPQSVLFACGLNSIRSPMAMALAQWLYRQEHLCRLGRRE